MNDLKEAVHERIEQQQDDLFDFADELVSTPSITGNEGPAQEIVGKEFTDMGLNPDIWEPDLSELADHPGFFITSTTEEVGYDGRPNVVAVREGSGEGPSLAFSGHIDVVSADESAWTYDPWTTTQTDGRMYGRGAADMKGGIAAYIHAIRVLDELDIELEGDLILQSTIEEEAGGAGGVLAALERGYQPDAAIIPEPYRIPNIGIASAGVMYFRVTVKGKAAHAARGYRGVNAIVKMSKIIDALEQLDRQRKQQVSYEPVTNRTSDAEGQVTNLNIGTIEAGDWPSTVPNRAEIQCRIGWPPGEDRQEIREQVEEALASVTDSDNWLAANPPEIEWFGWSAEPHEVDTSAEIVQLAKGHAEDICGESGQYIGGDAGLDERFYNLYYDIPCPTVGPRGTNLHGADEYVELDSLVETAQTLAFVAMDYCGVSNQ